MLGEFEYLLITAIVHLETHSETEAYGATIRQQLEASTGRACSVGAIYTTLDRLEAKGLLKTWMAEGTAQRGGRSRRMVHVTAEGIKAATHFYQSIAKASHGLPWAAKIFQGAGK